jgi:hypothetical protein
VCERRGKGVPLTSTRGVSKATPLQPGEPVRHCVSQGHDEVTLRAAIGGGHVAHLQFQRAALLAATVDSVGSGGRYANCLDVDLG